MQITNTVALVTGGASGLGRASVEAVLAKGGIGGSSADGFSSMRCASCCVVSPQ